jgi:GH24 family phage-related lysozyme (muramidase)
MRQYPANYLKVRAMGLGAARALYLSRLLNLCPKPLPEQHLEVLVSWARTIGDYELSQRSKLIRS